MRRHIQHELLGVYVYKLIISDIYAVYRQWLRLAKEGCFATVVRLVNLIGGAYVRFTNFITVVKQFSLLHIDTENSHTSSFSDFATATMKSLLTI